MVFWAVSALNKAAYQVLHILAQDRKENQNMKFRKKVSILGFVIGSVVDIIGTNIWGMFMTIYVLVNYSLLQTATSSSTELTERVLHIFQTNPLIFSANFIVGAMFSILGGYVGAYIAKHDELLNGALSSFLCVLSGLYALLFTGPHPAYLVLLEILALIISPILAMLGGYLRLKQRSRKQMQVMNPA
jgi:hypothetical protein